MTKYDIHMKNMIQLSLVFLSIILLSVLGMGCGNQNGKGTEKGKVSPDLVTNPITASGEKAKSNLPVMTFASEEHDFGLIVQGEKVAHTFTFTNTGGSELVISNVSATCGCTTPEWSKEPVRPGETGKIEVVFNSAGRSGMENKEVKILTNAQPNTVRLIVRAEIYVPKK